MKKSCNMQNFAYHSLILVWCEVSTFPRIDFLCLDCSPICCTDGFRFWSIFVLVFHGTCLSVCFSCIQVSLYALVFLLPPSLPSIFVIFVFTVFYMRPSLFASEYLQQFNLLYLLFACSIQFSYCQSGG